MSDVANRAEIETMACRHADLAAADLCKDCHGTMRKPIRTGHLWADRVWRKDRPPSEENIVFQARELYDGGMREPKPKPPQRKPVLKTFKSTQRTMLRERALGYAIQSASAGRMGPVTGAEIIAAAEQIERWIADTPMEEP